MAPTPKPKPKVVTKVMQQMEKKIRKSPSPPLKYENTRPAAKALKAASKMTPREAAARKIGSESLARRQSENTAGMWSNDKPRGQKVPKKPIAKDPTKIKGFGYGKGTR